MEVFLFVSEEDERATLLLVKFKSLITLSCFCAWKWDNILILTQNFEVEFCWSGKNVKSSIKVWMKLTLARWKRTSLRSVGAILIMSISRWQVWHCCSTKIDKMVKCSRVASDLTSVVPLLQYSRNCVSF